MQIKTKKILIVLSVCLLPMASFAYEEEWDDFSGYATQSIPAQDENVASPQYLPADQQAPIQVSRLDQEVLVLRAEMAKKRGQKSLVNYYISILDRQYILPIFKTRVELLREFTSQEVSPISQFLSLFNSTSSVDFPMDDHNAVVAIILPTTGGYASAGEPLQKALQEGLQEVGFKGKLVAIDSSIYDTAHELWNVLKYYEPNFIFGPLQKSLVAQWQRLNTGVATFYFNDLSQAGSKEYSLSPSKQVGLEQVFQVINETQLENLLIIKTKETTSQELEESFHQAWLEFSHGEDYETAVIDKNVGKAIDKGLNVEASKNRHYWLQKVLNTSLDFTPRVRHDIEAIISFVPQSKAIQIAPYLHFLPLDKDINNIWYPTKTPSLSYLQANVDVWQNTYAILPLFVTNESLRQQKFLQSSKNGLFYALGRVAVEIVKNPSLSQNVDSLVETEYGSYVRNSNGQFHLLPVVYWADKGVFEKFTAQSE